MTGVLPASSAPSARPRIPTAGARLCATVGSPLLGFLLAVTTWSALAATGWFPPQLFPGVGQVLTAGATLLRTGVLLPDALASAARAAQGLALGTLVGFVLAVLTSATAPGRRLLQPVLRLVAPVPTIGLVPLAILWFGIGEDSKITVIALGVFVPVWINSHAGLSTTPVDYLRAARCLGAGRWRTLTRVVLPEAAPDVVAGIRVGVAMAFVLLVVAEMTGTDVGLGYRIYQAQLFSQADRLLFCLALLGALGALCDLLLARATDPLLRWARDGR